MYREASRFIEVHHTLVEILVCVMIHALLRGCNTNHHYWWL